MNFKECKCPVCGYNRFIEKNQYYECYACGATFKYEEADEKFNNDLEDAARFLNDALPNFDLAYSRYNSLVERYPRKSAAYWGRLLSKYGIKYEFDSGRATLSCYYENYEDIRDSADYKKVLEYADADLKKKYEAEALIIADVAKVWRETTSKLNYDIFISFKGTDDDTNQDTLDRHEMHELYDFLVGKGYKVFFSDVTLNANGIYGKNCEPYIFNAIKKAKTMIVYGSKANYFESSWVRNEWLRYLGQITEGKKKDISLIVAYKGFNARELPQPLNKRQAICADSPAFYNDILEIVNECLNKSNNVEKRRMVRNNNNNISNRKDNLEVEIKKLEHLIYNCNEVINRYKEDIEKYKKKIEQNIAPTKFQEDVDKANKMIELTQEIKSFYEDELSKNHNMLSLIDEII